MNTDPKKQSGERASKIATEVLAGKQPTRAEIEALAASVLGQDEQKGQRGGGGSNPR